MNYRYITNYLNINLSLKSQAKNRDHLLDFAKGIAIILVVVGHYLQGTTENFDNIPGFRYIYAFHMPLFVFLAGASAAHWIKALNESSSINNITIGSIIRIKKAATHLLIPFISWTLFAYWYRNTDELLHEYLWKVVKHNDYSLWFLTCIFWCTTFTAIYIFFVKSVQIILINKKYLNISSRTCNIQNQMVLMLIVWFFLKSKMPSHFGLVFVNIAHGGLFLFFILGILFFKKFVSIKSLILRLIPYIVFFSLVPFWYRTTPNNLIIDAPTLISTGIIAEYYALTVALSGTLTCIDMAKILHSFNWKFFNTPMYYLGTASLGIYAIHYYFLGYEPQIIFAIIASFIITQIITLLPVVRGLFLGKNFL